MSRRGWIGGCAASVAFMVVVGCGRTPAAAPVAPSFLVERTGGLTSARALRGRPFNQSARDLTNAESARFSAGAETFDAHVTPADGLGPAYNEDSCLSCHLDGVNTVDHGAEAGPGLLVRLSVPGTSANGGPLPEPTYGGQLRTRSTTGPAAGQVEITYTDVVGHYPDGTTYHLRRPTVRLVDLLGIPLAAGTMTSTRIAPPLIGLGLLEAIPVSTLEAEVAKQAASGTGISGRINLVWDRLTGQTVVGRFGWKAAQPSVRQQTVTALHEDMGVTTPDFPDVAPSGQALAPEMDASTLADEVFYNRTIAVPIARRVDDPQVIAGANEFVSTGCAACHTPTQTAGPDPVGGIAGQTFHPYTDLLLHDLGPGLADGRPDFGASGTEWRTAPLWGLGRRIEVTGYHSFLHDGRARTVEEAILWHGGEADAARRAYEALPPADRRALLAFLDSL